MSRRCLDILVLLLLGVSGCRAPEPQAPPGRPGPPLRVGRVLRYNRSAGFVVLQCENLPSPGEPLRLYRGKETAGEVQANGPFHYPFAVADVLKGSPQRGDVAKRTPKTGPEPVPQKDQP